MDILKFINNLVETLMYWYESILSDQLKKQNTINHSFLKWKEDKQQKGHYVLVNDNETIGSLAFFNKSGRRASGKVSGDNFLVKKKGFINKQVVIAKEDTGEKFEVSFNSITNEGEIETYNQGKIYWKQLNKLDNQWVFLDEGENILLLFRPISSFYLSGYLVDIKDGSIDKNILYFLLLLGLYNLIVFTDEMSLHSAFL